MSAAHVVLLGPQRTHPTAGEALRSLGLTGPVATITAGWQEWEGDDGALRRQLAVVTHPLSLHARAERAFEADPELREAHRNMQVELRTLQRLYRRTLAHAGEAWMELLMTTDGPEHLLGPERDAALEAIQRQDERMLEHVRHARAEFNRTMSPLERPAVARERAEIARDVETASAVVIEGGHAAVLYNRFHLFGVPELLAEKVVVGCSAGAMLLGSRVFLYDDSPAIGRGHAEVGLPGLGFVPGLVALPSLGSRLRIDDQERMRRLAQRIAPDRCALLEPGSRLDWDGSRLTGAGSHRLELDGTLVGWEHAA